jgi:hypothetical protein
VGSSGLTTKGAIVAKFTDIFIRSLKTAKHRYDRREAGGADEKGRA